MRRTRREKKNPVDNLKESYDLLTEIIRHPSKIGYIGIISKLKPENKEIINLKLLQYRDEIDEEIKDVSRKILKKIGFDKLPDGTKG